MLRVCETAMTTKAKRDFVKKMHSANAEGFVCKNRSAAYAGGRAGQHFKCKFVATASFIVGPKPDKKAEDGHRSIAVYLLDDNRPRFMGTVGVPDRYPLPRVEQIVEVRYLYCHPGPEGKLIQAKYFGKVRDDIELTECTVSQLKFKASDGESSEVRGTLACRTWNSQKNTTGKTSIQLGFEETSTPWSLPTAISNSSESSKPTAVWSCSTSTNLNLARSIGDSSQGSETPHCSMLALAGTTE